MESGKWKVESGKWKVESGKWKLEIGREWEMGDRAPADEIGMELYTIIHVYTINL